MTEPQFESKADTMAEGLEERVEKIAAGMENMVNKGYRRHRKAFRIAQVVLSFGCCRDSGYSQVQSAGYSAGWACWVFWA